MMSLRHLVIICCAWLAMGLVGADEASMRIALCPLGGSGIDADANARLAIEDQLQTELTSRPGLQVVERSRIQAVLAEQALQSTSLIDTASAVRVGQLVQADALIVGACRASGDHLLVTLRLVRTSDAAVLWATEAEGSLDALAAQAPGLADACAAALSRPLPQIDASTSSLAGSRHHDHAQALHAQGLFADAMAEELLATTSDPRLQAARTGFAQSLADAGLTTVAIAEAKDQLNCNPTLHDPALSAIAALPMPPPVIATPPPPSARVRSMLAVLDRLKQLPPDDPQVLRDLIAMNLELGRQYTRETRDHAALLAFEQAMAAKRTLRRLDPSYLTSESPYQLAIETDPSPLTPGTCLLAGMRHDSTRKPDGDLYIPYSLPEVLSRAQAEGTDPASLTLPRGYVLTVGLTDTAYLTELRNYLLIHAPLADIPEGATIIGATLDQQSTVSSSFSEVSIIGQDWVGAEATLRFASAGRPWITYKVTANNGAFGRELPVRGTFRSLTDAMNWEVAHRRDAHGLGIDYPFDPRGSRPLQLHLLMVLPQSAPVPSGLHGDRCQQVIDGILALLDHRPDDARTLFRAAQADATPGQRFDSASDQLSQLMTACGKVP